MFDVLECMTKEELVQYARILERNIDSFRSTISLQNEIIDKQRDTISALMEYKRQQQYMFNQYLAKRDFDDEMHRKYKPPVKPDEGNRPVCADSPCECRSTSK